MPRFVLIGLCEPQSDKDQAAFDEWFIDQHIEDTAHCPHMIRGSVFKLSGPHLDIDTASGYLSLYEVEAETYEEAEQVLNDWQADSDAWAGRKRHLETGKKLGGIPMAIRGSGWYQLIQSHEGPVQSSD
ncbi:hypothetical protein EYC98_07410 [Halieaceae bacterium IMCC14734]|uniref:YCII-related domain-containing protein n=1 Tax=Candidatus Litorirhabdus singularis TaxID=2518993 RepID=A0ABT3TFB5_9GAMM|nr:hypothetical protein [Candidatus Litorirhabdus singularis]MCX2980704.1 hypothetical protein [Candidatus Litorirhabdus singularis]